MIKLILKVGLYAWGRFCIPDTYFW